MASRSLIRTNASSHMRVKTFYVALCAAVLGVVFAMPSAAQWFEPPVGAAPGGPNTDAPLYSAANPGYGGMAQGRTGPLTIGSGTPFGDVTILLYVNGKTIVQNALTVGTLGITPPPAAITGLSLTSSGAYGVSSNAAGAGVLGETLITGGKAIIGDASGYTDAVGIYGFAQGNNSRAISGTSVTGYAGYFEGQMKISGDYPNGIASGTIGELIVTGDTTFRNNLAVADTFDIGSLTIKGNSFEADKVNALSAQDQKAIVPVDDPGIRTFTLSSADITFCTDCMENGIIAPNTALEWNVGPTGTMPLIDETKVVVGYSAQYIDTSGGVLFNTLIDYISSTLEYQECDASGNNAAGIFRLTNDTGRNAQFRIEVWYKEVPWIQESCIHQPWRQVTVGEAVDAGDTVRISATGATAASIAATPIDQVRLLYQGNEIDIDITQFTPNVDLWFKAQATTTGADATNYALYYGTGGNHAHRALRNKNNVYALWDDFDDNSLDPTKWSTYAIDADSSVSESGGKLNLNHNAITCNLAGCAPAGDLGRFYTGASAYTNSAIYPFQKTGYYTITYDLTALMTEDIGINGNGSLGNDGVFIRNSVVNRDPTYYGGPAEKGVWFGMIKTCADNGTYGRVRTRGALAASWSCRFGTNEVGNYTNVVYANGLTYPYKLTLNANTGAITYQQPGGTTRISGTANAVNYATITSPFVLELHDGYGDSDNDLETSPAGAESYDNFLIRRGKNSLDPAASVGAEN